MLLFHFVGEVKNEMRRRRPTHIYIYIVLVYVCARSAPTAYACDYKTLSSFTQHSRLATRVPIHSMRMLCYSYFIMLS